MTKNIAIGSSWEALRDTSFFERYMMNSFQFSAAKSFSEAKLLQSYVFNENKNLRPFSQYIHAAKSVTDIFNETWLRVEYETARGQAVMAEKYRQMYDDKDIYPFWIYNGMMDARERPEHVALEGMIFRIGDPYGDAVMPRNGWNCRCVPESLAGDEIRGRKTYEGLSAKSILEGKDNLGRNFVDPHFRYNAGVQGMMPNNSSYFEIFPNANRGSSRMFGLNDVEDMEGFSIDTFATNNTNRFYSTILGFKDKYQSIDGNIVFQNKDYLLNILLTKNSIDKIVKTSIGVEHIPTTIINPDEIWGRWLDEEQTRVQLSFLKFGKVSYMVQTEDGEISKAYLINKSNIEKYRNGLIFLK